MKHPLLPDSYTDTGMHAAILSALKPYERMADSKDPHFKWDLAKAWQDAKELLKSARWHHRGSDEDDIDLGWEMAADTEEESRRLHVIIAGIAAYQIEHPASGLSIRRVDYRKGGEVMVTVSSSAMEKIKKQIPEMKLNK